ncbi:helix-turn-helix transcriptional regulator [Marinactinospora endophytica]
MSDGTTSESVGRRLARARKRRSLTQEGLAQRSRYSRSHIAQVERGHKVATPAFVAAAAAALGVSPAELYGQPYRGSSAESDRVHAAIPEIRRALAYVGVGPDLDGPARPLSELRDEVAAVRRLLLDTRLVQVGARLPALLEELAWHAHETDAPEAWALLNRALASAVSLTRRLGYADLAVALLDRGEDAARRSQDPHLPLLVALPRALLLAEMAQWRPAMTLLDRAIARVDHDLADAREVFGSLQLRAAVTAARAGDAAAAWERYGIAVETVERGPVVDVHATQWSAGNVALHGAAVATELRDMDEAVRRDRVIARGRVLAGLAVERRTHHEIDMARVHAEVGEYDRALERLAAAERVAPEMTRHHPTARTVVRYLVDVRRALPEPLRALHSRMGA